MAQILARTSLLEKLKLRIIHSAKARDYLPSACQPPIARVPNLRSISITVGKSIRSQERRYWSDFDEEEEERLTEGEGLGPLDLPEFLGSYLATRLCARRCAATNGTSSPKHLRVSGIH